VIRALLEDDVAGLLDLYGHLHEADTSLPEHSQIKQGWSEVLENKNIR